MEVCFITGNINKVKECESILGFKLKQIELNLDEIQAVEVAKVVEHKAKQAFSLVKKPVIVEDTGLYFEAWNGLPGALIKWFDETIGYAGLCDLLVSENRKAKAQTIIGYFDGKEYKSFVGEVLGRIVEKPKGLDNFGWDIIFIPDGFQETFAEMGKEKKNAISMRKIALAKLKEFL
ncbi:RdgB/HAM1 family non-canonical purine NTP pyrophosphatase [Candidatus Parcubacteria bacterium]|nr:RdgB/HAM1 family non-canonical purine NTP pyrophosphatase [Candidatus Parcubacteria bacterium]